MNTVSVYEYQNKPYFNIDIDADLTGFAMMELLIGEFAKLAKEALEEGNYSETKDLCSMANKYSEAVQKAKDMLAESEVQDEEE